MKNGLQIPKDFEYEPPCLKEFPYNKNTVVQGVSGDQSSGDGWGDGDDTGDGGN